jgi:hypothetical protein
MRGLSAAALLDLWERGRGKGPVERALEMLSAAFPEEAREALALRSIGQRDAALLALREATLGSEMQSVVDCAGCGQRLELTFRASDIRAYCAQEAPAEFDLKLGEYELRVRPPNSVDLAAAVENAFGQASQELFYRCLISANHDGRSISELPAEIISAAGEQMAELDSQTNVQLAVSCAFCGHCRTTAFDIASFFWTEIEVWAARLLGEIHELASAYGWTEPEILALSGLRRQFYLEAVRS